MAQKKEPPTPSHNLPKEAETVLFDMIEKLIHSVFKEMIIPVKVGQYSGAK